MRVQISSPDLEPEPEEPGSHGTARPRLTPLLAGLAAACSLAVLVPMAVRLAGELTREPTAAERRNAATREIARRYMTWPSGRVFPEQIPYTLDVGGDETARRVGISPDTRCETAVDPQLGASLGRHGCRAVLRAVYLDEPQGLAIAVGVAVFPDEPAARAAAAGFPARNPRPGLRTVPFPNSVTARFADSARQAAAVRQRGPYVVAATVGYVDGRPVVRGAKRQNDLFALAPQLTVAVLNPLTAPIPVDCDSGAWTC
ncbi:hypothetical protein ACGFNU_42925 [Spirillospora sp. NPDC048911]|uniref:hypothetical protein n=1 Tax=Spirillospora sp. NPDC048911 TaxID=3364527 RepID=UPI003713FDC4